MVLVLTKLGEKCISVYLLEMMIEGERKSGARLKSQCFNGWIRERKML